MSADVVPTRAVVRYFTKVAVRGPRECWLRIPECDRFFVSKERGSVEFRRVAWWIRHGYLPEYTRHVEVTCGTIRCVNPDHLVCPTTEDRFWSHVDRVGECWLWTGSCAKEYVRPGHHYGAFCYRQNKERVWIMSHRYSWELHNGPVPEGMLVCHKCDVPKCVRPEHLFLGTFLDNTHDCIAKGRFSSGKKHGDAVRAGRAAKLQETGT